MSGRVQKQRCHTLNNAARERSRVQSLRAAFLELQRSLPSVPPDTKLSKLDILVLATAYIYHLTRTLNDEAETEESNATKVKQTLCVLPSAHFENRRPGMKFDDTSGTPYALFSSDRHRPRQESKMHSQHIIITSQSTTDMTKNEKHHKKTMTSIGSRCCIEPGDVVLTRALGAPKICHPMECHQNCITDQNRAKARTNNSYKTLETKVTLSKQKKGAVGFMHPVKKWPMRCRFYRQILGCGPSS